MRSGRFLLVTAFLLIAAGFCWADAPSDLAKENAKLKQRVDRLEKEMDELKRIVLKQSTKQQPQTAPAPGPQKTVIPKLTDQDMQKILAMVQQDMQDKKPVWSGLDIQVYGYIKLDASYDTSRTTTGNFIKWVDSDTTRQNDNEFNMTANQTRLGFKITGPDDGELKTSGRVEIDFEEGGAENKARIMMRHAYMKLDWPKERFSIIAGQTSDVISPLNPYTLNYSVLWWNGNIGYRRPQIRFTKSYAVNQDLDLKFEAALARTIGRSDDDFPGSESGEDSGMPGFQGRVSATFPLLDYKPTTLGVSGHWAKEELEDSPNEKNFDSWSLNLDLTQPINDWLTIKGECFTGENLNAYLGGIGQGVRDTDSSSAVNYDREIGSKGGWIAASIGPCEKWSFNIGAGVEDVEAGDVTAGDRILNRAVFGNVIYALNKNTQIGFELSQWHTERKGEGNADNLRGQMSFIYKF